MADLNTARKTLSGGGIQTSAVAFGGQTPPQTGATESWNGTAWTEVSDLNTARSSQAGTGTSNTAAICAGGDTGPKINTETWDGTSWTTAGTLGTARQMQATKGAGNSTAALSMSGSNKPANHSVLANVEEWDGAQAAVKTVTVT